MVVLGLATMGTSSACLFVDRVLVAAVEEERLTRIKNDGRFPISAIKECLRIAGLEIKDVTVICIYWQPWRIGTRLVGTLRKSLHSAAAAKSMAGRAKGALFGDNDRQELYPEDTGSWADLFRIRSIIKKNFGECKAKIKFFDHHLCHQFYAMAIKPWPEAVALSYDGGGEEHSTDISVRRGRVLTRIRRTRWPNSLGHFYSFFTGFLGFKMLEGEYKMMGLAPYGEPRFKEEMLNRLLHLLPDGEYQLNTDLCDYHLARIGVFSDAITSWLGQPRRADEEPVQRHLDVAASAQATFEAAQRHVLLRTKRLFPQITRLFASGGCALNVTANGRVINSGLFEEIAVPPAPHDAGCAIGAALVFLGSDLDDLPDVSSPYLGGEFTDAQINDAFERLSLPIPAKVEKDRIPELVASDLESGRIVAWFQGRTEFGPRALGSRSFLADPRDDAVREALNSKIKKRELFRPFAPSVTEEGCRDFFEIAQPSPYMNIVAPVVPVARRRIPAVTHVDGTARVHTVSARANPLYHRLLKSFEARTGIPVLLNTSFNIQEPIVNTPEEAIRTYLRSKVDVLAIGGFRCDENWRKQVQ